jgi:hypothetical protein
MKSALITTSILIVGCASNSGVAPMGGDSFMVSRQAATGFSGTADLKAESLREANKYCIERGRELDVLSATESRPPFILGNYPRAEVQFRCVEPGKRGG